MVFKDVLNALRETKPLDFCTNMLLGGPGAIAKNQLLVYNLIKIGLNYNEHIQTGMGISVFKYYLLNYPFRLNSC